MWLICVGRPPCSLCQAPFSFDWQVFSLLSSLSELKFRRREGRGEKGKRWNWLAKGQTLGLKREKESPFYFIFFFFFTASFFFPDVLISISCSFVTFCNFFSFFFLFLSSFPCSPYVYSVCCFHYYLHPYSLSFTFLFLIRYMNDHFSFTLNHYFIPCFSFLSSVSISI